MATIRKRGTRWQVQVRRQGYPLITKTFSSRADAAAWARDKERDIDRGETPTSRAGLRGITVGSLLERYELEITSRKRGADRERFKLRVIRRHALSRMTLDRLTSAIVASYRDERLNAVKGGTVRRELAVLQHCFEVARKEWNVPISTNPVRQISPPPAGKGRERRLSSQEWNVFWLAVERARAPWLKPMLIFAIETGMRRGEVLSLRWSDVHFEDRVARLSETKSGHERTVPLSPTAIRTLADMPRTCPLRCFPVSASCARQGWDRLVKRSRLRDIRFHDLRHEAVSRFFELGLSVPEVALISGHRDHRMLARYTHLRPETVAKKLETLFNPPPIWD